MNYRVSISKRKTGFETVVYRDRENHYIDTVPTRLAAQLAANLWIARDMRREEMSQKFLTKPIRI